MKPLDHAKASVRRHGGDVDDYLPIHQFIDSTKAHHPTVRHRAVLHNSFGPYIAERMFPEERRFSVRQIVEEHVMEDCANKIPTVREWGEQLERRDWMRYPDELFCSSLPVVQLMLEPVYSWDDPRACLVWFHGFGIQTIRKMYGPEEAATARLAVQRVYGRIPDIDEWLRPMRKQRWMYPPSRPATI